MLLQNGVLNMGATLRLLVVGVESNPGIPHRTKYTRPADQGKSCPKRKTIQMNEEWLGEYPS